MSKIHILDPETVNKIAAGEVVSRPSSVVKELVENAIDAGARRITVEVRQGGKSFIRVTDDGHGMDMDDAVLSLVRHATSKINQVEDLTSLQTMGFRGEAIPSIASVSRFTLQTQVPDATIGTEILVEGGAAPIINALPLTQGTTLWVRDLFFNVPARLKYLKSDRSEFMPMLKFMQSVALLHPEIAISLIHDNRNILKTGGNGRIEDVLLEVFTDEVISHLRPIDYQLEDIQIKGYCSTPSQSRLDRDKQILCVNGRWIQSDLLGKAIRQSTQTIFPSQRYPYLFLHIEVPSSDVDVNVHPAKLEVKFAQESLVFRAVFHALSSLFSAGLSPIADSPVVPTFHGFHIQQRPHVPSEPLVPTDWAKLYTPENSFLPTPINAMPAFIQDIVNVKTPEPLPSVVERMILQVDNTFLIFEQSGELWAVDQHIAHERVLFEQLRSKDRPVASQELLIPETFTLDKVDQLWFEEVLIGLVSSGFRIDEFGGGQYLIRAIPIILMGKPIKSILKDSLKETDEKEPDTRYNRLLSTIACKAAVKAGDKLSHREREELIRDWLSVPNNMSCPHGRPIVKRFSFADMAGWFMRGKHE